MIRTPELGEDVLDSRDVIERIAELEAEDELTEEEAEELTTWKELAEQGEGYAPDWQYGEALIRDSYFETYAEELAEDIGAINRDASWPLTYIDWERAADALKVDYTSIEAGGYTYWVR